MIWWLSFPGTEVCGEVGYSGYDRHSADPRYRKAVLKLALV